MITPAEILAVPGEKWSGVTRGALEYAIRDAYAAGCSAAQRMSIYTAMEYAAREAPGVAQKLAAGLNK